MSPFVLQRSSLLLGALTTTAIVLCLLALYETPGLGLGNLLYIPVAMCAFALGRRGGAAAGGAAAGAWTAGVHLSGLAFSLDQIALRAVGFAAVGVLVGWFATEHRKLTRLLHAAASTDDLTGVGNSRSYGEAVATRIAAGVPFGVVVCDLDGLKEINDTDGHEAGDRAIEAFSTTIGDALRGGDLLFRVGGDEFVALVAVKAPRDLGRIQERLAVTTAAAGCAASFGAAAFPYDAESSEELYRLADERMYGDKRTRRQRLRVVELLAS